MTWQATWRAISVIPYAKLLEKRVVVLQAQNAKLNRLLQGEEEEVGPGRHRCPCHVIHHMLDPLFLG
jgi:hypothetical protein